jgi:hypothetical protein
MRMFLFHKKYMRKKLDMQIVKITRMRFAAQPMDGAFSPDYFVKPQYLILTAIKISPAASFRGRT